MKPILFSIALLISGCSYLERMAEDPKIYEEGSELIKTAIGDIEK